MTETKQAVFGVPRTLDRGFIGVPLPKEDMEKRKEERVLPNGKFRTLTPEMFGGVSEAIKTQDIHPEDPILTFKQALVRASKEEMDIHNVVPEQILSGPPEALPPIEQKRNGRLVLFDSARVFNLLLYSNQIEKLHNPVILSEYEMLDFLLSHRDNFRPAFAAALLWVLDRPELL